MGKGYLVVSRKINERIQISDGKSVIEILVSDIIEALQSEPKVDLGIKAPKEFKIRRLPTHLRERRNGS